MKFQRGYHPPMFAAEVTRNQLDNDVRAIYEVVAGLDQGMKTANGKLMQQRTWIDVLDQRAYAQGERLDALDQKLDALDQKLDEVLDLLRGRSGNQNESS